MQALSISSLNFRVLPPMRSLGVLLGAVPLPQPEGPSFLPLRPLSLSVSFQGLELVSSLSFSRPDRRNLNGFSPPSPHRRFSSPIDSFLFFKPQLTLPPELILRRFSLFFLPRTFFFFASQNASIVFTPSTSLPLPACTPIYLSLSSSGESLWPPPLSFSFFF